MTQRRIANSKSDQEDSRATLLQSSIDNLRQACMQMPTEPTYHNNLGLSYFESGNFENALGSYEEAIRLEKEKFKTEKDRSHENLSFYHKNLGLALYH